MVINWWVVSSHEKTHLEQRGSSVIRELKNRRPHKEREHRFQTRIYPSSNERLSPALFLDSQENALVL